MDHGYSEDFLRLQELQENRRFVHLESSNCLCYYQLSFWIRGVDVRIILLKQRE